jgi:uncharacterized protein
VWALQTVLQFFAEPLRTTMSYSPHDPSTTAGHTPGDFGPPPPHGLGPLNPSSDERMWGMLAHLASLLGFIPMGNFVGPLVVWLIKKDQMPFVDDQGKESLNFQITILLAAAIVAALFCTPIGIMLAPLLAAYTVIMVIIAAVNANKGIPYRYPFTLRLIR